MAIFQWIERLLARGTAPTEPAPSVFGASAERQRADQATADEYEMELAKIKGQPRGF